MNPVASCPLCEPVDQELIWSNQELRVIQVGHSGFPGYTRVIWTGHITEMTDLTATQRHTLMDVVWQVEQMQREILGPDKINLAQFGNMVPHLHWHIIPRWSGDSHFPESLWASPPQRTASEVALWVKQHTTLEALVPDYHTALIQALDALAQNR